MKSIALCAPQIVIEKTTNTLNIKLISNISIVNPIFKPFLKRGIPLFSLSSFNKANCPFHTN